MLGLPFVGFPTSVLESLWVDGSYTGELMLCEGLVQARREHMSQRSIKPVYYYSILVTHIIGTRRRHDTTWSTPELRKWESKLPNTGIARYVPSGNKLLKYVKLTLHVADRRVTFLSIFLSPWSLVGYMSQIQYCIQTCGIMYNCSRCHQLVRRLQYSSS